MASKKYLEAYNIGGSSKVLAISEYLRRCRLNIVDYEVYENLLIFAFNQLNDVEYITLRETKWMSLAFSKLPFIRQNSLSTSAKTFYMKYITTTAEDIDNWIYHKGVWAKVKE